MSAARNGATRGRKSSKSRGGNESETYQSNAGSTNKTRTKGRDADNSERSTKERSTKEISLYSMKTTLANPRSLMSALTLKNATSMGGAGDDPCSILTRAIFIGLITFIFSLCVFMGLYFGTEMFDSIKSGFDQPGDTMCTTQILMRKLDRNVLQQMNNERQ